MLSYCQLCCVIICAVFSPSHSCGNEAAYTYLSMFCFFFFFCFSEHWWDVQLWLGSKSTQHVAFSWQMRIVWVWRNSGRGPSHVSVLQSAGGASLHPQWLFAGSHCHSCRVWVFFFFMFKGAVNIVMQMSDFLYDQWAKTNWSPAEATSRRWCETPLMAALQGWKPPAFAHMLVILVESSRTGTGSIE